MRVGLIAPPWIPVPPLDYGGTELVLDNLARGLLRIGCDVRLFTTGDSTCPVGRSWLYERALGTAVAPFGEVEHVERAYRYLAGADVIHDHTVAGPLLKDVHPGDVPIVTTVHGEFTPEMEALYGAMAAKGVRVVAISDAQRRQGHHVPIAAVIHHGLDVASYPMAKGDGGYVVFLGRMAAAKGAHRAIDVARAAGRRIVLAAKMWEPCERRYFAEFVEPRLGADAAYIGSIGGRAKLDLLAGAEALLNPIRWPEPFGLVMVEALACGTPVLAFREGAAPEIIDDGVNGFLCSDEADMATKLTAVEGIDRRRCRASVEQRFSVDRMVADHLALYTSLMAVASR